MKHSIRMCGWIVFTQTGVLCKRKRGKYQITTIIMGVCVLTTYNVLHKMKLDISIKVMI